MKHFTFFWMFVLFYGSLLAQRSATFEELNLGSGGYWNGSDGTGKFTSGPFTFHNNYNAEWASWSGFAYSNHTDTVTPGWLNQYSAIAGSGAGQSEKYAIAYVAGTTRITLSEPDSVSGMYVTNSTYAYLSMRHGDDYTKKFGGVTGNDPDFFRLNIHGIKSNGDTSATIVFYLADFRFEQNDKDYIVRTWKWIDLDSLGIIKELRFSLESSDNGAWGMNTPAYFCIDNINQKSVTTGIPGHMVENKPILVYPNPFYDHINLYLPDGNYSVELRDLRGALLYKNYTEGHTHFRFTVPGSLAPGIYFLSVRNGFGATETFKIQKVNQ